MNCSQMESVLLDYAAGVMPANSADRIAVEHHLTACQSCRERAEGFSSVAKVLEDWDTPAISPWFNARLRQRIAAEEAQAWSWQRVFDWSREWLRKPVTAAAFAAVLMVGSLAVWTSRPGPVSPSALPGPVAKQEAQKPQVDELMPVVEDFDMLANFEVIQDLKTSAPKPPKNEM
jgi:hypothetical protein